MSHKSKSLIAGMVAAVALLTAYALYVTRPENTPMTLQSWAIVMIVFIGIGIVAAIIIQIVFRIVLSIGIAIAEGGKDSDQIQRIVSSTMAEDEMDRMISLRSERAGFVCAGIGFAAVLVILAFGLPAAIALNALFASFALGSLVSGAFGIYGYERGVRRG